MSIRATSLRFVLAALTAHASCGVALGAEWSAQPSFAWRVDHDSNRRLDPRAANSSQGAWLTLDATLKRATETSAMMLEPRLELQRFVGDSALDANNGSLQWSFDERSEMTSIGLAAAYERDSTLISELADTGIIDASTRRDTLSGSLGRDITQRQHLDLQASYEDTQYPDGLARGLVGYRYPGIAATYGFNLSPLTRLTATAYGNELTAALTDYESRDMGVRFGGSYALSPRVSLAASAGVDESTIGEMTQRGYLWNVRIAAETELSKITLSFDRSVQPSGLGVLVRRDDLGLSASRSIAPRLFATFSAHGVRNEDMTGGPALGDRRYVAGDAGLEWRPAQQWVLNLTAGLASTRSDIAGTARGWHTALVLHWAPRTWAVSR
jgi:hypothetical protein